MRTPAEFQNMEYRSLLMMMVNLLHPKVYVEIGVKKGYTFNAIAPIVEKAIGVDIHPAPVVNLPNVEFFQTDSEHFFKLWDGQIDFLFIDGNHKMEAVLADLVSAISFLKPYESMVFLHDTYPIREELLQEGYCSTAWKAAKYIRTQFFRDFETVTLPGPWAGLSILRYAPNRKHGWMDK
jgi:hypothetical protein